MTHAEKKKYLEIVRELQARYRQSQVKAACLVNTEMLLFYWSLGRDIVAMERGKVEGYKSLTKLSADLQKLVPEARCFSRVNLTYMRIFYKTYSSAVSDSGTMKFQKQICHQLGDKLINETSKTQSGFSSLTRGKNVDNSRFMPYKANDVLTESRHSEKCRNRTQKSFEIQAEFQDFQSSKIDICNGSDRSKLAPIFMIPWGHNREIFTKCTSLDESLFYVMETMRNNWSRAVLVQFIRSELYFHRGRSLNNFKSTLPKPDGELAQQIIKDTYDFHFLPLPEDYDETDLKKGLINNIERFLMEFGKGFSFVGREYKLASDEDGTYYVDLLLYHVEMHCYVVVEVKTGALKPAHFGQLCFYMGGVDDLLKKEDDNETIGLLICGSKNDIVAKWNLSKNGRPIAVSEYRLVPSEDEIEMVLRDKGRERKR